MRSAVQRSGDLTDDARFVVHNRKEVARILSDMVKQKTELNASFNHGVGKLFTSVVDVDSDAGVAFLDVSADEVLNRGLLASHQVVFSSKSGVRIQWSSTNVGYLSLNDGKAFRVAFPGDLIRVQRRDYYRLATPVVSPVKCSFVVGDRELELSLIDLGFGGIAAYANDPLDEWLEEGVEFDNCHIDFPDVGTTNLTLRINQVTQVEQRDGSIRNRLGLEFISPSRGNQALLQRYMAKLERELMLLVNR